MNNNESLSGMPHIQNDEPRCPNCGRKDIRTTTTDDTFTYGTGPDAVKLTINVPLRTCHDCKFQFLDIVAEDAQHEAICQHLGVLTPAQIQELRRRHQLSRAGFAQITKLGEASLARWERGELIQNAAYDQLLYLLTFEDNLERLKGRAKDIPACAIQQGNTASRFRVFAPSDADREAANAFELRRYRRGA